MALAFREVSRAVEGRTHIHPTTLVLEKGTMNVLLGPTLSGKTSLMRLMAGLDKPSSGSIHWNGKDVTGMRVQDRQVAMVYQQFINYPAMSVYDNIASPMRLKGLAAAEIDRAVRSTAEMLKLTPMLARKPLELSGGQQQRCALARALVKGAGLVLLDEPLANLDYKLREELRAEIPRIFEASGAIFVYATTEPEEALLLGGNTATLNEGRVTQFGLTPDVYRVPGDVVTARVFSDPPMNFIEVIKHGKDIQYGTLAKVTKAGVFSNLPDGHFQAGFRANHLALNKPSTDAIELKCQIAGTEITGSETYLHLTQAGNRWVGLVHGVHQLEIRSSVSVWLDPSYVYLFDEAGKLSMPAPYAVAA